MLRYASLAPSVDHQWATYVMSTSSVREENEHVHHVSQWMMILFSSLVGTGTNTTFIGPIRDSVGHVRLLVGGCEAQRSTAGARLVVEISVRHEGLESAADTEGADPLSE